MQRPTHDLTPLTDKRETLAEFLRNKGTWTPDQAMMVEKFYGAMLPLTVLNTIDYDQVPPNLRWKLIPPICDLLPAMKAPEQWDERTPLFLHYTLGPKTCEHRNRAHWWGSAGSCFNGLIDFDLKPGTFTKLHMNKTRDCHGVMMSDTPMERRTNAQVLEHAHGHVLISGAGIGMLLPVLLKLTSVTKITVLEQNSIVADYVGHAYAHPKLTILKADAFLPPFSKHDAFDVIYHDIWPTIGTSNLPEMNELLRKYRGKLRNSNPDRWIGCWTLDECRRARRRVDNPMSFMVPAHLLPGGGRPDFPMEE